MSPSPPRVAVFSEIPTPYRRPVFECLKREARILYDFYFLAEGQKDRSWGNHLGPGDRVLPGFQVCFRGHHTVFFNGGVRRALGRGYDALVIGGYAQPAMVLAILAAWKRGIPYVMMTESHEGKVRSRLKRWIKDPFVRRVYGRSGANLVASSGAADYVEAYGAPRDAVFSFPNAIDAQDFSKYVEAARAEGRALRADLGWEEKTVFLHVGHLNERKGVDTLCEAFLRTRAIREDVRLLLVGEGNLRAQWERRFAAAGRGQDVRFVGYVRADALYPYYSTANALVLASREEPFGAVVLEAMAAGLAVITTDRVGAARDFVKDRDNGRIVGAGSMQALADAMEDLAVDPRERSKMAARSREIIAPWTAETMARTFSCAVESALDRSSQGSARFQSAP